MEGDWSYEAILLSPEEFERGVDELRVRGYLGANVTVPHKRAALALADRPTDAAAAIGAANTLSFGADGVAADNTDAPGLIASLPIDPRGRRGLVLGAGGAARAAIWALVGAGAEVTVHNRTESRGRAVAEELGAAFLPAPEGPLPIDDFDIVVNATSVGLAGGEQAPLHALKALGISADRFSDRHVVVDLVYGTEATELVKAARSAGATVVDGLEILIRQGAESFRIWTGTEAPVEAMRAAIEKRSDGHA
jgi:shikimate dehydrogenase